MTRPGQYGFGTRALLVGVPENGAARELRMMKRACRRGTLHRTSIGPVGTSARSGE